MTPPESAAPPPSPPPREPIFRLPAAMLACGAVLIGLHALRTLALPHEADLRLLLEFALIPARWTVSLDPGALPAALAEAAEGGAGPLFPLARYVLADPEAKPWTFGTYALLHGSWGHVLLNTVWLAAFGTPVLRRCGLARFFALAAAGILAGAVLHLLVHPLSAAPVIGASAGVSGLMAAAARFVFSPVPFGPEALWQPHERPRLSLGATLRNRSAALFLGVWFVTNLLFGLAAQPLGITDAGIAWEAHVGGFLAGLLMFPVLDPGVPARTVPLVGPGLDPSRDRR